MGRAMAKGKRAVQEAATYTYATRSGQVKLMEELLLSIRRRVKFAQDAGISRIRMEMITPEEAEMLIALLERECRS